MVFQNVPTTEMTYNNDVPGWYVTSLLHERPQGEPQTVPKCKVVCQDQSILAVLYVPLVRTDLTDKEQSYADPQVRADYTHPDVRREGVHEREHPRLLFFRPFYHDANS